MKTYSLPKCFSVGAVIFLCVCQSCVDKESIAPLESPPQGISIRSAVEAKDIAVKYVSQFGNTQSRDGQKTASEENVLALTTNSSRSSNDTLLYVVNFDEEEGFAIVSSSYSGSPLLAYIEQGTFCETDLTESGFSDFIQQAKNFVENQVQSQGIEVIKPLRTKTEIEWTPLEFVEPKLKVRWGNERWERDCCPNGFSCQQVIAVAQLLSFYEEPKVVHDSSNKSVTYNLDWANLKAHDIYYHEHTYSPPSQFIQYVACPASDEQHLNLSRLIREIHDKCYADYSSPLQTTVPAYGLIDGLASYLDFEWHMDKYDEVFDVQQLRDYLEVAPVLMMSFDKPEGDDFALNAWVADGYQKVQEYFNTYREVPSTITLMKPQWELIESVKLGINYYTHYNWGMYGSYNGYFNDLVFSPKQGAKFDYENNIDYDNAYDKTIKLAVVTPLTLR